MHKTADEWRISDWSSDVCSSDLAAVPRWRGDGRRVDRGCRHFAACGVQTSRHTQAGGAGVRPARRPPDALQRTATRARAAGRLDRAHEPLLGSAVRRSRRFAQKDGSMTDNDRSEEHTYELQSLMRNSYAVFCLKKKHNQKLN